MLAGVVGVSVALAERAVDSVAGYAEDVAAGAVAGGFGAGWRSVAVVAGRLARVWVGVKAGLAVHGCAALKKVFCQCRDCWNGVRLIHEHSTADDGIDIAQGCWEVEQSALHEGGCTLLIPLVCGP